MTCDVPSIIDWIEEILDIQSVETARNTNFLGTRGWGTDPENC